MFEKVEGLGETENWQATATSRIRYLAGNLSAYWVSYVMGKSRIKKNFYAVRVGRIAGVFKTW